MKWYDPISDVNIACEIEESEVHNFNLPFNNSSVVYFNIKQIGPLARFLCPLAAHVSNKLKVLDIEYPMVLVDLETNEVSLLKIVFNTRNMTGWISLSRVCNLEWIELVNKYKCK